MYVLENQNSPEMYRPQGDIFLAQEVRLPDHIIQSLDALDRIALDSVLAKQELEELPEKIVETRNAGIDYIAYKIQLTPEQWEAIAIVETLDERASMYADVASKLQKYSLFVAEQLLAEGRFPIDIGGTEYCNWCDSSGVWLCFRDSTTQDIVLFNCWENLVGPGVRIASFDDYIQLLQDVRRNQEATDRY